MESWKTFLKNRAWGIAGLSAAFVCVLLLPINCGMTPWEFQVRVPPLMATGPGGLKSDKVVLGADGCADVKENSAIKVLRRADGGIQLTYAHIRGIQSWLIESVQTQREDNLEYILFMKTPDGKTTRALAIPDDERKQVVWSMPDEQHTVYYPVKCFRLKSGQLL